MKYYEGSIKLWETVAVEDDATEQEVANKIAIALQNSYNLGCPIDGYDISDIAEISAREYGL